MARVIYEEFQDKEGNVHYLHTEDKVVFTEDGRPLRTAMNAVQFEDYSGETELPSASQALAGIAKGRKWTDIFSAVKAFCKRAVTVEAVGDAFSETNDYQAGDYAIYNNALYKFTADKAAGAWDGTKADAVKVADEIRQLNGNMTDFIIISGGSINIGKLSAGEQGDKNVPINPPEGYKYFTYACGCSSPEISVHKYSNGTPKIIYRAISGVSSALLFYEVTYVKK